MNEKNKDYLNLWQKKIFGCQNYSYVKEIIKDNLANAIKLNYCNYEAICEICLKVKQAPIPKRICLFVKNKDELQLIDCALWYEISSESIRKNKIQHRRNENKQRNN